MIKFDINFQRWFGLKGTQKQKVQNHWRLSQKLFKKLTRSTADNQSQPPADPAGNDLDTSMAPSSANHRNRLSQPFHAGLRACNDTLRLNDSRAFRAIVSKAFDVCDDAGDGTIDATELYVAVLLVHLNLAKFAGPAACYPPSRGVCRRLFQIADRDGSGGVDRDEFHDIAGILCAQILSRMMVYYLLLILCVPILATGVIALVGIHSGTYLELVTRESVSWAVFCLAVPLWWNSIDARYTADGSGRRGDHDGASDSMFAASADDSLRMPSNREERRRRLRRTLQQKHSGEIII